MFIKPTSVFKHGKVQFEPVKVYGLGTALGYYFIAHRWAEAHDGPADIVPSEADLGPEPAIGDPDAPLQPDDAAARPAS